MQEGKMRKLIGENLMRIRKRERISQGALAKAVGVSRQTYSAWENGHSCPPSDALLKLSRKLGCTVADLLDQDPDGRELLFLAFRCDMERAASQQEKGE